VQDVAIPVPVVEPQPTVSAPEGVHDGIDNNVPLEEFLLEENHVKDAPLEEAQPTEDELMTRTGRPIHKNHKFFGDQSWANYQYGKDPKQKSGAGCLNDQFLSKLTWD
jgi:hypothetical protein